MKDFYTAKELKRIIKVFEMNIINKKVKRGTRKLSFKLKGTHLKKNGK